MEKDTLVQLIQNANSLSSNDAEILEEIAISYPYCQNTYFLLAKYAQKSQDDLLVKKIRRAATYAYNRDALRNLIEGEINDTSETPIFDISIDESNLRQTRVLETIESPEIPSQEKVEISEEEINESNAMELVQNGEDAKAVEIYKLLIARYPEKDSYYRSQISVLLGEDFTEVIEPIYKTDEIHTEESVLPTFEENRNIVDTYEEDKEEKSESFFDVIEEAETPSFSPETIEQKEDIQETESNQQETSSFFEDLDIDKDVEVVMPPQETEVLEENPPNVVIPDDDIEDEKEAVFLFNQGKIKEAVAIYEKLMDKFPQKKSYYQSQINVLQGYELESEETIVGEEDIKTVVDKPVDSDISEPEENLSFFDNLETELEEIDASNSSSTDDDALTEGQALDLFNEGRTDEAVKIYQLLMEKHPEKADYYKNQINILKN